MSELIRNEIGNLAEIILEQTNKLLQYSQGAPQIEVDITKENLRKLYTHLDILVNPNWQQDDITQNTIEEGIDEQVNELIDTAEEQFHIHQEEIKQQIQEQHEVIEDQNLEEEEDIEVHEDVIEAPEKNSTAKDVSKSIKEVKEKVKENEPEKASTAEQIGELFSEKIEDIKDDIKEVIDDLGDKLEDNADSLKEKAEDAKEAVVKKAEEVKEKAAELKEKISETAKTTVESIKEKVDSEITSLGDKLQKKPIKSLKSAIGINDKFQFINELFDGRMKKYNEAIEKLDTADTLEDALNTLDTIAKEKEWDSENPSYEQLRDFVERRYSV